MKRVDAIATKPTPLLVKKARELANDARSEATRRAYRADWRDFSAWCVAHQFRAAPPVPGEIVALYIADLAEQGKALSTIARRLAAIAEAHAMSGHLSPRGAPALREVLRGIRRRYALDGKRSEGKAALELEQLRMVSKAMENHGTWLSTLRDRAILVCGWAGGFRRGELAALELADFELREKGYVVTVRRSKTDQTGRGEKKILPFGSDPMTCPVRSFDRWVYASAIGDIPEGKDKAGRVFRSIDRHGNVGRALNGRAIAQIVKARVAAAGLDPENFSGHSLRAGFCTTAAKAGKNPKAIMAQTGHRSVEMVLRYVRDAGIFEDNAAMGLGL